MVVFVEEVVVVWVDEEIKTLVDVVGKIFVVVLVDELLKIYVVGWVSEKGKLFVVVRGDEAVMPFARVDVKKFIEGLVDEDGGDEMKELENLVVCAFEYDE